MGQNGNITIINYFYSLTFVLKEKMNNIILNSRSCQLLKFNILETVSYILI